MKRDSSKRLQERPPFKAMILLLAIIHAYPFLTGYRLTADDVSYHWHAMNGIQASFEFIKSAAISQGRIVHFPDLVTSLLGANYADSIVFRIFYVSLFFLNFFLFSHYINRAFDLDFSWYFFFILLTFHPLDYFHTSPGSYPFKISFPILLILLARLKLLKLRFDTDSPCASKEYPWLALCLFAMLFSEYAFAFASSIIIIECVSRTIRSRHKLSPFGIGNNSLAQVFSRSSLHDLAIISLFLLFYLGFRLIFPSSYDGNKLPESFDFALFLKTLSGHIVGGSVASSFLRESPWNFLTNHSLTFPRYLAVLATFTISFIICLQTSLQFRGNSRTGRYCFKALTAGLCSLMLAVIITLPVAITTKYQSWCTSFETCVFLDSSLSYLGFGLFLGVILLFITQLTTRAGSVGPYVFSALLALVAAASILNNFRLESTMKDYVSGWERAKALACYPGDRFPANLLSNLVEPVRRISMHSGFDSDKYWSLFIEQQRASQSEIACENKLDVLFPNFENNKKLFFSESGKATSLLAGGWSSPESWGTWSNTNSASLLIPIKPNYGSFEFEVSALVNEENPFQQFDLFLDDSYIRSFTLKQGSGNIVTLELGGLHESLLLNKGLTLLTFKFHNAISPRELGINTDERTLALGLVSISIRHRQ